MSASPAEATTAGKIPTPRKGFLAPDFSLETLEGGTISLSELRGRPVLINLWTSWCPPCRAEMPAMQKVYVAYQEKGFLILAVNITNQDKLADAVAFSETHGLTFPILLDVDGNVSRLYQLRSLPTSFFVDPQGIIKEVIIGGPMSEALLRIRIEQFFEEMP